MTIYFFCGIKKQIMDKNRPYSEIIETLINLVMKGSYKEALRFYLKNVKEFNTLPELRNIGGDILNRLNNKEEAIIEYERCIELYRKKKHFANAIAIGKKVLRIAPHYEHIYEILGDVYMEAGLVSDASLHYLEYAERKRRSSDFNSLKDTFHKIAEMFGEDNRIFLQTLPAFPELRKEFNKFIKERKAIRITQKKDLIEMIKRDPKYEIFNKLVLMELSRSRRFVRPFSIFSIEINFLVSHSENSLPYLENIFGILKNNMRTIDYIFLNTVGFFYGLLPETPSDGVFILSDRLVNRLKDLYKDQIKISMRWATYPKDGQKIGDLLESLKKSGQVYFQ